MGIRNVSDPSSPDRTTSVVSAWRTAVSPTPTRVQETRELLGITLAERRRSRLGTFHG